jgi:hypothetical protein
VYPQPCKNLLLRRWASYTEVKDVVKHFFLAFSTAFLGVDENKSASLNGLLKADFRCWSAAP